MKTSIRNRIKPINPNTQLQADIRYAFSIVAKKYTDLSAIEKDQWDEYAKMLNFWVNRLGESYTPSGRQVFQYCNLNLVIATAQLVNNGPAVGHQFDFSAIITNPIFDLTEKPAPPQAAGGNKLFEANIDQFGNLTLVESLANFQPPNGVEDKQVIVVQATPFFRPTMRNVKKSYRLLKAYSITSAQQLNLTNEMNAIFQQTGLTGEMSANVRLYTVNKAGLRSDYIEQRIEII